MSTSEILDQRPPADPEAETWVVGSVLMKPALLDQLGFIDSSDFYNPDNAALFAWMRERHDQDEPIDVGLLRRHFSGDEWAGRIADIVQAVPVAHHAKHYAAIVAKAARLRKLCTIAVDLLQKAHGRDADAENLIDSVETAFASMRLSGVEREPVALADAAVTAMTRIDAIQQRGEAAGVPTGLLDYDQDQGGLFPGELVILAARPGVGKTSLAMQIAAYNAGKDRLVYLASLEMSASELSTRLACGDAAVSNRLVRTGKLTTKHTKALSEAFTQQARCRLDIDDRPALTVAMIRREIRKRKKKGLVLAIIDYLQLVQPDDRRLPREQQVARMVRSLKETAREYDIPILCLCQLNRQADGDDLPRLSHLRESGAIEQDADVVLFLAQREATDGEPNNAVLLVAKNRNGEVGPLPLFWNGPRTRFSCPDDPMPAVAADSPYQSDFGSYGG